MPLKVEKGATGPPKRKPKCPVHLTTMKYNPEKVRWDCTDRDCRLHAWPENDADKTNSGRPVLGRGELEVVHTADPDGDRRGRYFIRAMDNNVMLDVTDVLSVYPIITVTGGQPDIDLSLTLHNMSDQG